MNGIAVLLFGLVMYGCLLWFMHILKIDSKVDSGYYRSGTIDISIILLGVIPIIAFFLWPLTYVLLSILAKLPQWNLGLIASLNNSLILSLMTICLALALVFYFKDRELPRMQAPLLISIILLLGGSIYNLIQSSHDNTFVVPINDVDPSLTLQSVPTWMKRTIYAFSNMTKVSVLSIFLFAKSYLGPLATGYVFCSILYTLIINGKVEPFLVVLGPILDWVFEGFPYWASSLYLVIQVTYNVIFNGFDSLHD